MKQAGVLLLCVYMNIHSISFMNFIAYVDLENHMRFHNMNILAYVEMENHMRFHSNFVTYVDMQNHMRFLLNTLT